MEASSSTGGWKCIQDDEDFNRILQGCTALRPQMSRMWKAIGKIPLDETKVVQHVTTEGGDVHFIPNLLLFSFDEEKRVPLVEELLGKGFTFSTVGETSFTSVGYGEMKKVTDSFGADPVKIIKDFVNQYPKVLFAGVLSSILHGNEIQAVLRMDGDKFIYQTRNDQTRGFYRGQTALIRMILLRQSAETLKTLIEESWKENHHNAQDDHGRTAVHWCAALNYYDQLRAILPFCPNLELKDKNGDTALDLAVARGFEGIQALIRGPTIESEEIQCLKMSLGKKGLLDFVPPVYEPSRGIVSGEVNKALLGFLEREYPEMLKQGSTLVIIPNEFPSQCPFSEEARKKGWENERRFHQKMKTALERLCEKHSNQKFLFSCGCRYAGISDDGNGNLKKKELEIDGLLLTHGQQTGGMVMEVKSGTCGRDFLRKGGPKQLENHITILQDKLACKLGFVKKCLVTPDYPAQNDPSSVEKFKNHLTDLGMVGLNKRTLDDVEELCQWLEVQLGLNEDQQSSTLNHEDDYAKVLAWALVTMMGVIVPYIAQNVDDATSESVTALLTTVQFQALHLTVCAPTVPTVISGGYGTGKSFLAEQKILSLDRQGSLSKESKLLFICGAVNKAFNAVTRRNLQQLEGVTFQTPRGGIVNLTQDLKKIQEQKGDYRNVKFIIIDQFEDFLFEGAVPTEREGEVSDFWEAITTLSQKLRLVWILFNPGYSAEEKSAFMQFQELVKRDCDAGTTFFTLGRTLRNTSSVCNFMEARLVESTLSLRQVQFAQPSGIEGPPLLSASYHHQCTPGHFFVGNQCIAELECMASTAARVLHDHIPEKNLDSRQAIFIHDINPLLEPKVYKQFLTHLDRQLVNEFQQVKKERLLSMGPVLIHSPMELITGMWPNPYTGIAVWLVEQVQDHIHGGNLERALETLVSSIQDNLRKDIPGILEDLASGILLRLLTLLQSNALLKDSVFRVLENLKKAFEGGDEKLKEFFDCYRFIGIHYYRHVDGYESNVVVGMTRLSPFTVDNLFRSASRAKVMATLVCPSRDMAILKSIFPSLETLNL